MKNILTIFLLSVTLLSEAQVKKAIVVEHFTNTRCGICAGRNPGLFANLGNNPEVLHMAIHPSSPYSSCVLYQHNKTENDARTNYYGILGSTPRIVINGTVLSGATNFTSTTLFDPYKDQTSPLSIEVMQETFGTDSVVATVKIKAVSSHSHSTAMLYLPLVEDSLQYAAPNGENLHHNVFRKNFYSGSISLPSVGDSTTLRYKLDGNNAWDFNKLKTLAIISENGNKKLIQASESGTKPSNPSSLSKQSLKPISLFPNPTLDQVTIKAEAEGVIKVYDIQGSLKYESRFTNNMILDLREWQVGVYTMEIVGSKGRFLGKLVRLD